MIMMHYSGLSNWKLFVQEFMKREENLKNLSPTVSHSITVLAVSFASADALTVSFIRNLGVAYKESSVTMLPRGPNIRDS